MAATAETPRTAILFAVLLTSAILCVWVAWVGWKNPPFDPRITNVVSSASGRWLAAGTAQGRITLWDQTARDARRSFAFSHGSLNDLQFSPNEHALAIASADLAIYPFAESVAPRLLRSDHENYGCIRFSRDGQTLLTITGSGIIETIDAHSGASQLKICCSSIYGEAVFTPDGLAIANAGHWPSLWDARSGQLIAHLTANREFLTFRPIAFDLRCGAILMGSQDGRVYAWHLRMRQLLAVSPPQPAYVDTLAVSANGWVISAGFGQGLELWNPQTGHRRRIPAARPTSNLVVGSDGASIIFGTANGALEFWDLPTEQRIRAWKTGIE